MPNNGYEQSYGGFRAGGMELALPMSALREVVPCRDVISLPCVAPCVIGGIDLRGVVIPVVDLRLVLGLPAPRTELPCVILMIHEGKLLGLLAENVTGIFRSAAGGINRMQVDDRTAAIFFGGVRRQDTDALVSVLSPQALASLHQVPLVDDPEPQRQMSERSDDDEVVIDDRAVPMMLVRCGRVPLAIEAMAVHATVSHPQVSHSVLAMGHCKGVMAYAGAHVPAVDLQALCGLGAIDMEQELQAFIVSLDHGHVAFLVHEVVDVVRTVQGDVIRVPAFALPAQGLFAGALPCSTLPQELAMRPGMQINQYLVIDSQALKAQEEVASLSQTNTPLGTPAALATARKGPLQTAERATASRQHERPLRDLITYELNQETATPLSQVAEILPYPQDISVFETGGAMKGLLVNRGRSIPVFCLCRLTGAHEPDPTPESSVLVVDVEGERVGFAVPRLRSIEASSWEPEMAQGSVLTAGPGPARQLALVGAASGHERLLPVLDLQALARDLHGMQTEA